MGVLMGAWVCWWVHVGGDGCMGVLVGVMVGAWVC